MISLGKLAGAAGLNASAPELKTAIQHEARAAAVARNAAEAAQRWLALERLRGATRHFQHHDLDVRDRGGLAALFEKEGPFELIVHCAAQPSHDLAARRPLDDFDVNAGGTLNLLEALRAQDEPPPLVFTSTNKVYGGLPDLKMRLGGRRYEPEDAKVRGRGIDESRPLDFHSPYGCSKGTADQYVIDYARTFGLRSAGSSPPAR